MNEFATLPIQTQGLIVAAACFVGVVFLKRLTVTFFFLLTLFRMSQKDRQAYFSRSFVEKIAGRKS